MRDCKGWTNHVRNVSIGRFILTMVLVLACGRGWAQTTGSLLGLITDQNGAVVPGTNLNSNPTAIASIRSIAININLLTTFMDTQTKMRPALSMSTTVKLNNF